MQMPRKSFYLMRHGQTRFNLEGKVAGCDHDIALNDTGREQAKAARGLVRRLEIDFICHSPMLRAVETMDLAACDHACRRIAIENLKECPGEVGMKMFGGHKLDLECVLTKAFFDRALEGIREAISHGDRVLIVAHGGLHRALCHNFGIEGELTRLKNCEIAHFSPNGEEWTVKKISIEKKL